MDTPKTSVPHHHFSSSRNARSYYSRKVEKFKKSSTVSQRHYHNNVNSYFTPIICSTKKLMYLNPQLCASIRLKVLCHFIFLDAALDTDLQSIVLI